MWIGIDLGGTNTKIGLVNEEGKIVRKFVFATKDFPKPDTWIKRCALDLKNVGAIRGIGIGVPGAVDFYKGRILYLPNIAGWEGFNLVDKFKNVLKRKVNIVVDNDATAMAWAEFLFGAAKGNKHAVCITLGTGVGSGIILNGEIYRGRSGVSGELGHFPLFPWGKSCSCGGQGCLERYVGNKTLVSLARKMSILKKGQSLADLTEMAKSGEKCALDFWDRVAYTMAPTIIGVVNFLNPEIIVIGGGVAGAGRFLLTPLKRYVKKFAMKVQARDVKLVLAKLRNNAGIIGAAMLAKS